MSMRDYAVEDYGLLLDEEAINVIAAKVLSGYTDEYDIGYELYSKGICECISDFTGEALEINGNGVSLYGSGDYYKSDVVCYVPVSRRPSLFKQAYNNMDELVEELKGKMGEYLTEDFDYRNNIRYICGTYYG